ncbi:MAG TPA: TIGR04076 family protein [Oscillospiraceae bacterium]|nr:TIGR04076 family protein [Oscillospiraceae bacterium]
MTEEKKAKVRITILKKTKVEDVHSAYAKETVPVVCAKGEEGLSYLAVNGEMPADFCPGAWRGLAATVELLAAGGTSPYTREEGIAISSCNDGLHPVIFKLERVAS